MQTFQVSLVKVELGRLAHDKLVELRDQSIKLESEMIRVRNSVRGGMKG